MTKKTKKMEVNDLLKYSIDDFAELVEENKLLNEKKKYDFRTIVRKNNNNSVTILQFIESLRIKIQPEKFTPRK